MHSDHDAIALVTGATGFLGPHICASLSAGGWRIRKAVHGAAPAADSIAIGSLDGAADWTAALTGVSVIVHLAARAHRSRSVQAAERDLYVATNVDGTVRLAECAAEAGVRHFVFMSSVGVYGASSAGRAPFLESDRPAPQTVYAATKAAAEAGLRDIARRHPAMAVTAVRAPLIYGPAAKGNFAALQKILRQRIPLPLAGIDNHRAFVAADNVASFVAHRLSRPAAGFDVFNVSDNEPVSTPEFIRRLGRAQQTPARLFPLPPTLLRSMLYLTGRRELADSLLASFEISIEKALQSGWLPSVSLDEGLARAVG